MCKVLRQVVLVRPACGKLATASSRSLLASRRVPSCQIQAAAFYRDHHVTPILLIETLGRDGLRFSQRDTRVGEFSQFTQGTGSFQ